MNQLIFLGGSIGGDLNYKSPADAKDLQRVTVAGATSRSEYTSTSTASQIFQTWLWGTLATLITALALFLLVPRKVEEEVTTVQTKFLTSLGIGFVTLFIAPIAAMLLFSTVVAMPLGLILMALYAISLYIAFVIGQIALGTWLLKLFKVPVKNDRQHMAYTVVVGVIVTMLLTALPGIGTSFMILFFIVLLLPSLGAMFQWMQGFVQQQTTK